MLALKGSAGSNYSFKKAIDQAGDVTLWNLMQASQDGYVTSTRIMSHNKLNPIPHRGAESAPPPPPPPEKRTFLHNFVIERSRSTNFDKFSKSLLENKNFEKFLQNSQRLSLDLTIFEEWPRKMSQNFT